LSLKTTNSILDVGCGTGTWLKVANDLGIMEILGIDGVEIAPEDLKISPDRFIRYDLTSQINLNKHFDMLFCLEVAEHLPEEYAGNLIDTLTTHSDFIVFSAAIPGQDGQNHLNEQWPNYWQELFLRKGYYPSEILRNIFWNNDKVEWWYKQNMLIFAPKSVLSGLNLEIATEVKSIVHPELLKEKLAIIDIKDTVIKNEVWAPTFKTALKRLFKTIIH